MHTKGCGGDAVTYKDERTGLGENYGLLQQVQSARCQQTQSTGRQQTQSKIYADRKEHQVRTFDAYTHPLERLNVSPLHYPSSLNTVAVLMTLVSEKLDLHSKTGG